MQHNAIHLNDWTKRHLLVWCQSQFYADTVETMWLTLLNHLKTLDVEDARHLVSNGWPSVLESYLGACDGDLCDAIYAMRFETIRAIAFLWRHWKHLRPITRQHIFRDMAAILGSGKAPTDDVVCGLQKALFNIIRLYDDKEDVQDYPGQFIEAAREALAQSEEALS